MAAHTGEPLAAAPSDRLPAPLPHRARRRWLLITLVLGLGLFVWQLGSTGLVDETPPLFAASARAMAETGDWLIPRVNGLPRYDKPPLVYWLMGMFYLLPGQELWNPLGTWAARLPSALASVVVMLALADTLLRWPQTCGPGFLAPPRPGLTALSAALAFALSPLVLLWGRTAVSDALFSGLVTLTLLLSWRCYADPRRPVWSVWVVLGLAVLAKGPVAVVLLALSLLLFGWLQADLGGLWGRLRPIPGLALSAAVALPWYAVALLVEGRSFWDSFFGYHNLQRFTEVVNDHSQPWWFFVVVLVVASLPLTPLLLLGLARGLRGMRRPRPQAPEASLGRFAACWLMAVFLFFTAAATKLPSYWLPATPAAALLIAVEAQRGWASGSAGHGDRGHRWAWRLSVAATLLVAAVFAAGPLWVTLIQDPELPTLPTDLLASGLLVVAAVLWLVAGALGWTLRRRPAPLALVALQAALVVYVPLALLPMWALGDDLRGRPVREIAVLIGQKSERSDEPVAMVGVLKPSLHYYSRRVVLYEGRSERGLVNLSDRLARERRDGQEPSTVDQQPSVLVVIDEGTAVKPYWKNLGVEELGARGLYRLWRVDRRRLEGRAEELRDRGRSPNWQEPVPERY